MGINAEHQGPRRHAEYMVIVNGQDISSKLDPYLISIQVIDNVEGAIDKAHIELDDRNGQLAIPPDGASMVIMLGWAGEGPRLPDLGRSSPGVSTSIVQRANLIEMTQQQKDQEMPFGGPGMYIMFTGTVESCESGFGRRGGGRRLWIDATGANNKGDLKTIQQGAHGEGQQDDSQADSGSGGGGAGGGGGGGGGGQIPLMTVMKDMFGKAGLNVKLSPMMADVARQFWHINDSPMNFGQRIAREVGGVLKIAGNTAMIIGNNEGVNADGRPMTEVDAVWGINLIGWRIKPYTARPQHGSAAARYFKMFQGEWDSVKKTIGQAVPFDGFAGAANLLHLVADKTVGEQSNTGGEQDSKSKRSQGWVLMNGEPRANAGGRVQVIGARPGVDASYYISEAEHNYTRSGGYTTRLVVKYGDPPTSAFGWKNDPGRGQPATPPVPEDTLPPTPPVVPSQQYDPLSGEKPAPPVSGDQQYTQEEWDKIRAFEARRLKAEADAKAEREEQERLANLSSEERREELEAKRKKEELDRYLNMSSEEREAYDKLQQEIQDQLDSLNNVVDPDAEAAEQAKQRAIRDEIQADLDKMRPLSKQEFQEYLKSELARRQREAPPPPVAPTRPPISR